MAVIPVDVILNVKKIQGLADKLNAGKTTGATDTTTRDIKTSHRYYKKIWAESEKNRKLNQDIYVSGFGKLLKSQNISVRLFRKFLGTTGADKVSGMLPTVEMGKLTDQVDELTGEKIKNIEMGADGAAGGMGVTSKLAIMAGALLAIKMGFDLLLAAIEKIWRNLMITQKLFEVIKKLLKLILLPIDAVIGGALLLFLRLFMPILKVLMMAFRPMLQAGLQSAKNVDTSNPVAAAAQFSMIGIEILSGMFKVLFMGLYVEWQKGINNTITLLSQTFIIALGNLFLPLIHHFLGGEVAGIVAGTLANIVGKLEENRLIMNKELDDFFIAFAMSVSQGITDLTLEETSMATTLSNMATHVGGFNTKVYDAVVAAEGVAEKHDTFYSGYIADFQKNVQGVEEQVENLNTSQENFVESLEKTPVSIESVGEKIVTEAEKIGGIVLDWATGLKESLGSNNTNEQTQEKVGFIEGIQGWISEVTDGLVSVETFNVATNTFLGIITSILTPFKEFSDILAAMIILGYSVNTSLLSADTAGKIFIDGIINYIDTVDLANKRVIRLISDLESAIASARAAAKEANESRSSGMGYDDKGDDMIITKTGKVIKTHPNDNIIASKSGGVGGGNYITVNVNGFVGSESQLAKEMERIMYKSLRRQTGMGGGA